MPCLKIGSKPEQFKQQREKEHVQIFISIYFKLAEKLAVSLGRQ